jgi:hypothetical protein
LFGASLPTVTKGGEASATPSPSATRRPRSASARETHSATSIAFGITTIFVRGTFRILSTAPVRTRSVATTTKARRATKEERMLR